MIWDDHDVHDDWNISRSWVEEYRRKPWWNERIAAAGMTYWIYQHLGNLSPEHMRQDDIYARVREADDAAPPPEPPATPAGNDPAPTAGAGAAAAPAGGNPEEMVAKLFDPLLSRLKTELRLDRERRGSLTDLWH